MSIIVYIYIYIFWLKEKPCGDDSPYKPAWEVPEPPGSLLNQLLCPRNAPALSSRNKQPDNQLLFPIINCIYWSLILVYNHNEKKQFMKNHPLSHYIDPLTLW